MAVSLCPACSWYLMVVRDFRHAWVHSQWQCYLIFVNSMWYLTWIQRIVIYKSYLWPAASDMVGVSADISRDEMTDGSWWWPKDYLFAINSTSKRWPLLIFLSLQKTTRRGVKTPQIIVPSHALYDQFRPIRLRETPFWGVWRFLCNTTREVEHCSVCYCASFLSQTAARDTSKFR